jgi:hypothetical protein
MHHVRRFLRRETGGRIAVVFLVFFQADLPERDNPLSGNLSVKACEVVLFNSLDSLSKARGSNLFLLFSWLAELSLFTPPEQAGRRSRAINLPVKKCAGPLPC